jgi:hypothetical protein
MSIYRDRWELEAERELIELEEKKSRYGWTKADAERYHYLLKDLGR